MTGPEPSPDTHGHRPSGESATSGRARGSITIHPLADPPVSGIPVDPVSVKVLVDSFEAVRPNLRTLTHEFYRRLFELHPRLRSMFPTDIAVQEQKLADTLTAVIDGMRDPAGLRAKLHSLGRLHADKGVVAAQYPVVTNLLLECMGSVSGAAWTSQVHHEWRRALEQISAIMLSQGPTPK